MACPAWTHRNILLRFDHSPFTIQARIGTLGPFAPFIINEHANKANMAPYDRFDGSLLERHARCGGRIPVPWASLQNGLLPAQNEQA